MALPRLTITSHPSPLGRFARPGALIDYDLDPAYQRGHVWTVERQRNLIRSLLMGLPIGAIILNDRFAVTGDPDDAYVVVDGKQRITALCDFTHDGLCVPRDWFDDDLIHPDHRSCDGVFFRQLSDAGKRIFFSLPVTVVESQVPIAEEADLFELVNFSGVPQTL